MLAHEQGEMHSQSLPELVIGERNGAGKEPLQRQEAKWSNNVCEMR